MRILCLHGYASSAHAFSSRHLKALKAHTATGSLEFECVDGACEVPGGRGSQRCWFSFHPDFPFDRTKQAAWWQHEQLGYVDVESSLTTLAALWDGGEWDGILGF